MIKEKIIKKLSILIALTLIITSMSAFVLPENARADEEETTEAPANPDEYELVAHRGFSGVAPENSMPAFQKAVEAGFEHIEFDIQRCKPDSTGKAKWVISHDNSLERLCGVNKLISDMTVDEIKKYNYKAGNNIALYHNVKVVSYEEMIKYIKQVKQSGQKVDWRIEIKKLDDEEKPFIESEIVQPLIDAGVEDCVTLISFYYSNLYNAIANHTDIKICYLAEVLSNKYLDYAIALRDKWHARIDTIVFRGSTNTTDEMEMKIAMENGFKLGVYAIDSRVMMGAYYDIGIRSFTTNEVAPNGMSVNLMKHKYTMKEFTYKLSKSSYTFTNTRKKPKFTVTYQGKELLEGLCYETSYANNKLPGKAVATATGLHNTSGEKDKNFTITMPKVKGFAVSKNYARSLKFTWTANTDVTGYKVYQYNYSTKKYNLVKTISKNTTNYFKATKLSPAAKYRYRVKTYYTEKKKTYNSSACTAKTTYTKPDKISKIKFTRSKSGKIGKVKIGALARVTGYQVKVATDKNFTANVKSVTSKKAGKIKIKKLKKTKKYYAKARGYLKVSSVKYYGAYSKVVKKKGKK